MAGRDTSALIEPDTTYRCRGCGQLLPFDDACRVPDVCVERCRGRCDWVRVAGPADGR